MSIKSSTLLNNGLTRFLYEDGSYIDREKVDKSKIISSNEEKQNIAKRERDDLLKESDWIIPLTDHPQHAAYITYRKALRDWPSTADFPDKKPTLGS